MQLNEVPNYELLQHRIPLRVVFCAMLHGFATPNSPGKKEIPKKAGVKNVIDNCKLSMLDMSVCKICYKLGGVSLALEIVLDVACERHFKIAANDLFV